MTSYRPLAAALVAAAALLSACGEERGAQEITADAPSARIKFFNFGVNAPGVHFYANDTKMTAVSSTTGVESTAGSAYGAVVAGGFYAGIAPGQYTLTGRIAATADNNLAIASVPAAIADGKSYSFYLSGFYNTASKQADAFVVEDAYPAAIDYSVALVRFVNAVPNSSPMTLYARSTATTAETAVGAAVAYKAAGAFVPVPGGVYDLNTRTAGSTANAITRTAVSFVPGRVYTIGARGDMTVTSTTATNRPFLDNTANR
jgi:hypothetical protein